MFEDLKLTEQQQEEVEEYGYLRLELDEAISLFKPYDIGITRIAESFGMLRGNVRTQFNNGSVIDFFPKGGKIRMTRLEKVLKEGEL